MFESESNSRGNPNVKELSPVQANPRVLTLQSRLGSSCRGTTGKLGCMTLGYILHLARSRPLQPLSALHTLSSLRSGE
jgi:hypothetical protein